MRLGLRSLSFFVAVAAAAAGCGNAGDGDRQIESVDCPSAVAPWSAGATYAAGAIVSYNGAIYQCRQGHTALSNWTPDVVLALWLPVTCSTGGGQGGGGGSGGGGSGGGGGGGTGGSGGSGGGGGTGGSGGSGGGGTTGNGNGSLVFSAYKDTSINMDWNTNVAS